MDSDLKKTIDFIADNITNLTPHQVTEFTCTLSICYGRLGEQVALADRNYAKRWLELRTGSETATEAKMKAQLTDEYIEKKVLDYEVEGIKETIHALKKRLVIISIDHSNTNNY
ncbi:MAG: hypothetical protein KAV18_06220 [Candidatus Omnitrophica bacterium]|nr:hypothetical protein [Candidatus Omnitrophota bacterium]